MQNLLKKTSGWIRKIPNKVKWYTRRKIRRSYRLLRKQFLKNESRATGQYDFAIVCVKRPAYVQMAMDNINSLHFLNEKHRLTIYCDQVCLEEFSRIRQFLDYPEKVRALDFFGKAEKPWQYYKIETLITASKSDQILVDADSFWYHEAQINREVITMLVLAYEIKSNPTESLVINELFKDCPAAKLKHYVSGFVSIPSRFMDSKLESNLRRRVTLLLDNPLDFLGESDRRNIRRLAEELAVNISIQLDYPGEIQTLKSNDGPKDRKIVQSLYYGCANQIVS